MPRIAKTDVHQALQRAASIILDADGGDGRVSRADMSNKLASIDGNEKALADMFYRFIDHRDHKRGAVVTTKDVTKAVAYAKNHLIDAYDLNHNGLSRDEIADMSSTGQLAVALARELKKAGGTPATGDIDTGFSRGERLEMIQAASHDYATCSYVDIEDLPDDVRAGVEEAVEAIEGFAEDQSSEEEWLHSSFGEVLAVHPEEGDDAIVGYLVTGTAAQFDPENLSCIDCGVDIDGRVLFFEINE